MEQWRAASDDLAFALRREAELIDMLTAYSREKEQCLLASDAGGLKGVLEEEEVVVLALRGQEKRRDVAALALARAAGLPGGAVPLSALLAGLGGAPGSQALSDAGQALTGAVSRLRRQNKKVGALLNHQLGYAEYMLRLLCVPRGEAQLYDMQGNREEKKSPAGRLDYHA